MTLVPLLVEAVAEGGQTALHLLCWGHHGDPDVILSWIAAFSFAAQVGSGEHTHACLAPEFERGGFAVAAVDETLERSAYRWINLRELYGCAGVA